MRFLRFDISDFFDVSDIIHLYGFLFLLFQSIILEANWVILSHRRLVFLCFECLDFHLDLFICLSVSFYGMVITCRIYVFQSCITISHVGRMFILLLNSMNPFRWIRFWIVGKIFQCLPSIILWESISTFLFVLKSALFAIVTQELATNPLILMITYKLCIRKWNCIGMFLQPEK